jgi:hypothetical protein
VKLSEQEYSTLMALECLSLSAPDMGTKTFNLNRLRAHGLIDKDMRNPLVKAIDRKWFATKKGIALLHETREERKCAS